MNGGGGPGGAMVASKGGAGAKNGGGSGGAAKDGMNGDGVFSATGFTGNPKGLPSSKPQGIEEVLGYGDSTSF